MHKKIIVLAILIIGGLLLINSRGNTLQVQNNENSLVDSESLEPADKVEVVNFFGTQRCVACLQLGTLTKKTIEERFATELESGRVTFLEVDGQLPENKDMVVKYQARGSSLYINAIRGEQERIAEEVTIWRLLNNEEQFMTYLENKINTLLGK